MHTRTEQWRRSLLIKKFSDQEVFATVLRFNPFLHLLTTSISPLFLVSHTQKSIKHTAKITKVKGRYVKNHVAQAWWWKDGVTASYSGITGTHLSCIEKRLERESPNRNVQHLQTTAPKTPKETKRKKDKNRKRRECKEREY
jgi:hypothetical protein